MGTLQADLAFASVALVPHHSVAESAAAAKAEVAVTARTREESAAAGHLEERLAGQVAVGIDAVALEDHYLA